jgi:capsular exopolysaccharide synthesis family protein
MPSPAGEPRRRIARLGGGASGLDSPVAAPVHVQYIADEPASLAATSATIWRFLAKHIGLIGGIVLAFVAAGICVSLLTRLAYTGRATLQIDRQTERVVNNEDQTPIDNLGEEYYQTQYALLRSRSLATRVSDDLGLATNDDFRNLMYDQLKGHVWPDAGERRREMVIDLLQHNLSVAPVRGSRLVGLGFTSPSAELSARITNAFAENFIAAAMDRKFESASYARDFLERRIAQVKTKLEESERALVAYAASQQIIQLPSGSQTNPDAAGPSIPAADLQAFDAALSAARADRIRAEQKWREAKATQGVGLSEILQSPTYQTLSQEHARAVAEYQDKLRVFKPDYPDMVRLKARADETQRQMDLVEANIRQSLRTQYEAALANETALASQVSGLKTSVLNLRGRSIQYNILQREVDTNRTLYDGLLQRYKEVGVAGGVSANNISIIDRAQPPTVPSQPKPLFDMIIAGGLGLCVAVCVAVLRDALDHAIRTPEEIDEALGLPLLGIAPRAKRGVLPREAIADARSPLAEAFQSVRSALQFSTPDGFPKTLLVTSPWPGTGKTTTAYAISQYLARLGFRVLLAEGDLRHPTVAPLVEAENELGLTTLLTGGAALKDAVQATNIPNLFVLTAGPPAPNPAELLAGSRLPLLIAEASAHFDKVIFDGPPVMGLADAPILGAAMEGSILVVEAGKTTHKQVKEAQRRMAMAGAHVLGAVLNKAAAGRKGGPGYGADYGYGYYYGEPAAKEATRDVFGAARRLISR